MYFPIKYTVGNNSEVQLDELMIFEIHSDGFQEIQEIQIKQRGTPRGWHDLNQPDSSQAVQAACGSLAAHLITTDAVHNMRQRH